MSDLGTSLAYQNDLDNARREIARWASLGWPLPTLVWRARSLYRAAWKREQNLHCEANRESGGD
jgi:hypothetical protein